MYVGLPRCLSAFFLPLAMLIFWLSLALGFAFLLVLLISWVCFWFYLCLSRGVAALVALFVFWPCMSLSFARPLLGSRLCWSRGCAYLLAFFLLLVLLGAWVFLSLGFTYLLALLLSWFACLLAWPGLSLDLALFDFWLSWHLGLACPLACLLAWLVAWLWLSFGLVCLLSFGS